MAETTTTTPIQPEVKPAKRGSLDLETFPTEAAALEAVKDRVKGHRRVFIAEHSGKKEVFVASHPAYVGQYMFQKLGGAISEAGKTPRGSGSRALSAEAVIAAIGLMPEAEKNAVLEQLKLLKAKK